MESRSRKGIETVISTLMPTYGERDLAFERGEGAYLYSTDGKRYLDFACGIAVTALGHAHPRLCSMDRESADRANSVK